MLVIALEMASRPNWSRPLPPSADNPDCHGSGLARRRARADRASAERDAGKVHVAARRGSAETGCYRRQDDGAMGGAADGADVVGKGRVSSVVGTRPRTGYPPGAFPVEPRGGWGKARLDRQRRDTGIRSARREAQTAETSRKGSCVEPTRREFAPRLVGLIVLASLLLTGLN